MFSHRNFLIDWILAISAESAVKLFGYDFRLLAFNGGANPLLMAGRRQVISRICKGAGSQNILMI